MNTQKFDDRLYRSYANRMERHGVKETAKFSLLSKGYEHYKGDVWRKGAERAFLTMTYKRPAQIVNGVARIITEVTGWHISYGEHESPMLGLHLRYADAE